MPYAHQNREYPTTLTSLGGSGGFVTGSCHIVENKDSRFAVDWGLFQGRDEERTVRGERMNLSPLGEQLRGLTHVLISHGHIDHIGGLPRIFKAGFSPKIITTTTTADLMGVMLENSAQIQANEKPGNRLYNEDDVERTMRAIEDVEPFEEVPIGQKHSGITAEFDPNGHIIGSNAIVVRIPENGSKPKTILFSGDMGRETHSLDGGSAEYSRGYPQDPINTLVVESTSIEKTPVTFEKKRAQFLGGIQRVWERGGNVLLPVLSLHRLQEELELLWNSKKEGLLEDCNIFLDTPLGMKVLGCIADMDPRTLSRRYGNDPNYYRSEEESIARFDEIVKKATVVESHEQSVNADAELARAKGRNVVFASGGMGEHGRAVNYLKGKFGQNPLNGILFTCFQVEGTDGSKLVRVGAVHPHGKDKTKKGAEILQIDGFSSHVSGPEEAFAFLEQYNIRPKLDKVIVTHGRDKARQRFGEELIKWGFKGEIILPKIGQRIEV
jgi:metallo-beta-lactamase family protein